MLTPHAVTPPPRCWALVSTLHPHFVWCLSRNNSFWWCLRKGLQSSLHVIVFVLAGIHVHHVSQAEDEDHTSQAEGSVQVCGQVAVAHGEGRLQTHVARILVLQQALPSQASRCQNAQQYQFHTMWNSFRLIPQNFCPILGANNYVSVTPVTTLDSLETVLTCRETKGSRVADAQKAGAPDTIHTQ